MLHEKGVLNYEELERQADAIENGTATIDRLSLAEEEGRTRGGRTNVEASLIIAASEEANRGRQESELRSKKIVRFFLL
ncbi:MAG: hypothetical protein JNL51_18660 [Chitinophagaceae bacterium]|nr:hypothetical protein [Chitinophagaceae bacterium]